MSETGRDTYVIEVTWDRPTPDSPNPPSLVGPFDTREDAHRWIAHLIEPQPTSWLVTRLASPASFFVRTR